MNFFCDEIFNISQNPRINLYLTLFRIIRTILVFFTINIAYLIIVLDYIINTFYLLSVNGFNN